MEDKELAFSSAYQLAKQIKEKVISPVELLHVFLKRIEHYNPQLYAFLDIPFQEAVEAARRAEDLVMQGQTDHLPLLGVPIAITDTFHLKGHPTTFGSLVYQHDLATEDGLEVQALKEAGAIILAKANVSEFLFYPSTENRLGEPSRNPWDLETSGGNSGIACALAAGLSPAGVTADMHAGARVPSCLCGTFGLKPTRGRVPVVRKHLIPISERNFYQKGPMTRHIVDAAILLDILVRQTDKKQPGIEIPDYLTAALEPKIKKLRIGWSANLGFIPTQQDVLDTIQQVFPILENFGHQVEEVKLELDEGVLMHYHHILSADRLLPLLSLKDKDPNYLDLLTDYTLQWMHAGERVTGMEYSVGLIHSEWIKDEVDRLLETYDLIITPVVFSSSIPIPLAQSSIDLLSTDWDKNLLFWAFTIPFTMSGHPAASIPCGLTSQSQPVGMQVIGNYFSEDLILSFASLLEKTIPWAHQHPPFLSTNS